MGSAAAGSESAGGSAPDGPLPRPSEAPRPDVVVCPDRAHLAAAVAARIAQLLSAAIDQRGRAVIALAGGSTPREVHHALAARAGRHVDWSRVVFAFGDERMVGQHDPRSNAHMARETLLRPLGVAWRAVLPVSTGVADAAEAARRYERSLRALFAPQVAAGESTFDLVVLGMGDDGHTASLFPDEEDVLAESERWVRAATAPEGAAVGARVTLTLPAIAAARHALFLVAGAGKHEAVHRVLGRRDQGEAGASEGPGALLAPLPAARVRARSGVAWWLDAAAWHGARADRD